ncbi:MAG: GIY-YIG nuclease family protein [Fidelibacterota bacterium]
MWYVYCLENREKDFLYIGSTNDLKRRLEEHRNGYSRATKSHLFLETGP